MKITSSYNLYSLIVNHVTALFKNILTKQEKLEFPERIDKYVFNGYFKKIGPRKSYSLAIYIGQDGKKAIAKMTNAHVKGYHYYSLLNEITIYKSLNNAMQRLGRNIPEQFKEIYIPKHLFTFENNSILVSLIEYVEGTVAENLKPEEKITIYFTMVDFIQFIGKKFTLSERKHISRRTSLHYIGLYPLLVLKSLITYPKAIPSVLKSVPLFIYCIPTMIKNSKLTLVHRDLHFMNILLLNKGGIALVDFQQCVYTEPLYEMITTLRYWWKGWKDEKFGQLLMTEIVDRYSYRKHFSKLFQAYAINSVTHGLTGRGFSVKIVNGWIDFLNFNIHPDFNKFKQKHI